MNARLYQCALVLQLCLQNECPKDSTNLSRYGISIVQIDGFWYVQVGNENYDYAVATNEGPIERSPSAKEAGNIGWVNRGIEAALPSIKQIMSEAISQADLEEYKNDIQRQIQEQYDAIQKRKEELELPKIRG